jgi:hypothetical protein
VQAPLEKLMAEGRVKRAAGRYLLLDNRVAALADSKNKTVDSVSTSRSRQTASLSDPIRVAAAPSSSSTNFPLI